MEKRHALGVGSKRRHTAQQENSYDRKIPGLVNAKSLGLA